MAGKKGKGLVWNEEGHAECRLLGFLKVSGFVPKVLMGVNIAVR